MSNGISPGCGGPGPQDEGWGLSLEYEGAGELRTGVFVLFNYDRDGLPRWALGATNEGGSASRIPIQNFMGFCHINNTSHHQQDSHDDGYDFTTRPSQGLRNVDNQVSFYLHNPPTEEYFILRNIPTLPCCIRAAVFLILLPLTTFAQDFAIEGPVEAEWSELISSDAGNEGVQGLRDWPGANRVVTSPDGGVVFSFANGSYSHSNMSLQARNAETGAVLWQVTPCPEVAWHSFNVCMIEDMEITNDGGTVIVAGRKEVSTEGNVKGSRTDQAWVAAFDAATGNLAWQHTTDFGGALVEPSLYTTYLDLTDSRVLLASSLRVKYLGGSIQIGAFAALDMLTGAEQWSARVGTEFNDEFTPNDSVLSSDQTTWYVGGIADAEVWPCDNEGICGPHPTVKNYTSAFGLIAINIATGVLTDLSERSLPYNEYQDAKSFSLALSDDGTYLYQVGTVNFTRDTIDSTAVYYTSRVLVRLASPTGNHAVVHDAVHATFPTSFFYFGDGEPPTFNEEFNSCGHGQVGSGTGYLYWHLECTNTETGDQGSVVTALIDGTWAQSWQSVQYSDQEWADDLTVTSDGKVLASGGTWDDATAQLNGFIRALDPESGDQVFRAQYQAFENPIHAGKERIHDIATSGERVFGRVSMGNSASDSYQMIALSTTGISSNAFHLRCYHEPLWPQAGDTVTIALFSQRLPLDGTNRPSLVERSEIWLDVSTQPIAFRDFGEHYALSYKTEPLTEGQQFTYGCRGLQGDKAVFSGWRMVSVGAPGPSQAIPVSVTGPSSDRIDIVLVADTDSYDGPDDPEFIEHMGELFQYVFEDNFYTEYQHMFNFWIAQTTGSADRESNAGDSPKEIVKPHDWEENYAFADVGAIIHTDSFREFTQDYMFTFTYSLKDVPIFRHEAGHWPFGLSDEYCCDSRYYEQREFPNVYESLESCENDAPNLGRSAADCRSWVSERNDETYYTSEPEPDDLMNNNKKANAADIRRMEWTFQKCLEGKC